MSNPSVNSAVSGRPRINSLFLPCEASYLWRHGLPGLDISITTSKLASKSALNSQSQVYLPPLNREYESLQPKNKSANNVRSQLYISIPPFDFRYLQPIGGMQNKLVCKSEEQDLSLGMPMWSYAGVLEVIAPFIEEDLYGGAWRPVIWEQDEVKLAEWKSSLWG